MFLSFFCVKEHAIVSFTTVTRSLRVFFFLSESSHIFLMYEVCFLPSPVSSPSLLRFLNFITSQSLLPKLPLPFGFSSVLRSPHKRNYIRNQPTGKQCSVTSCIVFLRTVSGLGDIHSLNALIKASCMQGTAYKLAQKKKQQSTHCPPILLPL